MEPVRPLRDVLAGLTEPGPDGAPPDPRAELAAAGHGDLPDDLLVTAITGYAGTAPAEVAEHLATFLAAPDAATGLDLLTTAPDGPFEGEVLLDGDEDPGLLGTADDLDAVPAADASDAVPDPDDLDAPAFGEAGAADPFDAPAHPDDPTGEHVPGIEHDDPFAGDVAAADLFDAPGPGPLVDLPVDDAEDGDGLDDLDG